MEINFCYAIEIDPPLDTKFDIKISLSAVEKASETKIMIPF